MSSVRSLSALVVLLLVVLITHETTQHRLQAKNLKVIDDPAKLAKLNKPRAFTVMAHGANPVPVPTVPVSATIEARITKMQQANRAHRSTRGVESNRGFRVSYIDAPAGVEAVVDRACAIWAASIDFEQPVTLAVQWLTNITNPMLLAYSVPSYWMVDMETDLIYPAALGIELSGFNMRLDVPSMFLMINQRATWYIGTDGHVPTGQFDLLTVVLHELGHGLGILGAMDHFEYASEDGMCVFDRLIMKVADNQPVMTTASLTNTTYKRLVTPYLIRGRSLYFDSPSRPILMTYVQRFIPGSSVYHLDQDIYSRFTNNGLMSPAVYPGEVLHTPGPVAVEMLVKLGYTKQE